MKILDAKLNTPIPKPGNPLDSIKLMESSLVVNCAEYQMLIPIVAKTRKFLPLAQKPRNLCVLQNALGPKPRNLQALGHPWGQKLGNLRILAPQKPKPT